jgi:hypothetical protein
MIKDSKKTDNSKALIKIKEYKKQAIIDKPPLQETYIQQEEFGGAKGPEPTRYGDWQHNGRVSDF